MKQPVPRLIPAILLVVISLLTLGYSILHSSKSPVASLSSRTELAQVSGSVSPVVIFITSGTTWTVPSDWNSSNNTIEVIGGGGGGDNGSGNYVGGGGGAYAKSSNISLTPLSTVTVQVGSGGASTVSGTDTYFCNSISNCSSITGTGVVVGAKGGASGTSGGTGGSAGSSIGNTKYSGGNGGTNGGGGGGAAGPHGAGANGGNTGGGGGGGGGGTAGANGPSGSGGNNFNGVGGGTGATVCNNYVTNATAGTNGGGGGGGLSTGNYGCGSGASGGSGTEWTQTSGASVAGSGGGGGGGTGSGGSYAGNAGSYGAGGAGIANSPGNPTYGGGGAEGIIVITYTPASNTTPPSVPTNLSATPVIHSTSAVNLSWSTSTDSSAPIYGYKIYRNSAQIATTNSTSYEDTGLTANTQYSYTVAAYDDQGNTSNQSPPALVTTRSTSVSDIYISQSGGGVGASCSSPLSVAWFNTASSWGTGINQIGPGDTVHLCGTISTALNVQGSGTAGNPITILFEPNAAMIAPDWPSISASGEPGIWGAITIYAQNYITINGGTNGIIEATEDGTSLPDQTSTSEGVGASGASYLTVENLTISDMYVRTSDTDESGGGGIGIQDAAHSGGNFTNFTAENNIIHDATIGIAMDYGVVSNVDISHNTIYNVNWGGNLSDDSSLSKASSIFIHDNHIYNFANWDDPDPPGSNQYHHNGFYAWAQSGGSINGISFYNNTIGPNFGGVCYPSTGGLCSTSGIFLSNASSPSSVENVYVYNNLFLENPNDGPGDDLVTLGITGPATIVNNTFVGQGSGSAIGCGVSTACLAENNLDDGTQTFFLENYGASEWLSADYDLGYGLDPGEMYSISPNSSSNFISFAGWQAAGFDTHGINALNPLLNSNGQPQSNSSAFNAGTNLTSLCSTITSVMGTSSCPLSFDILGTPRPSSPSCPWDIGAYQVSTCSGSGNTPPPPTTYTLSVTPPTGGTITSSPSGISCGSTCTESGIPSGTSVTLTETPSSGYSFSSWGGSCSGTSSTCTLTISSNTTVTASFTQSVSTPSPTVTITASPTSITSGNSSTLTWSSTNATSCTASNGWTGGEPTSGTQSVSPTITTIYSLSCTGSGGTATANTTVTVSAIPPPVISAVSASNITSSGATVSWTTSPAASSQVVYGLTAPGSGGTYSNSTALNSSLVTSHSVSFSSLQTNTVYHYAVISTASGVTATSSDQTLTTLPSPDTTPPVVSITAPSSNATVSGTVTLSANASDPTVSGQTTSGVATVQFKLDGVNLGQALTTAPYSGTWNTTGVANGSHTITAVATDGAGNTTTSAGVSVTVNNVSLPPVVSLVVSPLSVSAPASFTLSVTASSPNTGGSISKVLFYNGSTLLSTDSTAPYSYAWSNVGQGNYTLTATAYDNGGLSTVSNSVSVSSTNVPPVFTTTPPQSVNENSLLTFAVSATDGNGDTLTYSASNLPTGATFTPSTRAFSWTPSYSQSGTYQVTFTVNDGHGGTASETITITVVNVDRPPVANAGNSQTVTLPTNSVTLTGSGSSDPDGDTLSYAWTKTSGPSTYSISNASTANPTVTFTGAGTYVFQLSVSDGTLSASASVTITVNAALAVIDDCPNTPSSALGSVNTVGCPLPLDSDFTTVTNLSNVNLNSVSSFSVGNSFGSISFAAGNGPYDLLGTAGGQLDLNDNISISSSSVSLNSTAIPQLDKPATVTLNGVSISPADLEILQNGTLCSGCSIVSYADTTLVFTVPGFSTYTVVEVTPPDTEPPLVEMISPLNGSTFAYGSSITLSASSSDNVGVTGLSFFANGSVISNALTTPPYMFSWTPSTAGTYDIQAVAHDAALNYATSTSVSITVNAPTPTPTPVTSSGGGGGGASGSISLGGGGSVGTFTPTAVQKPIPTVPNCPTGETCTPIPLITKTLSYGTTDPQVELLQKLLNGNGYPITLTGAGSLGQETTYFGSATLAALKKLQCAELSLCSGALYGETTSVTQALLNSLPNQPITTSTPTTESPTTITPPASTSLFNRTLTLGSTGSDVKALQEFLNSHGFIVAAEGSGSEGHETDYFGPATKTALIRFQAAHGISPTGFFGPITMGVVNTLVGE